MPSDACLAFERSPLRLDLCGDLTAIRDAAREVGYTEEALSKLVLLGETGRPMDAAAVLHRIAGVGRLGAWMRLFVLARSVERAAADAALGPQVVERLLRIGLVKQQGSEIRAEAALMPFEDLLLLRDFWPDFLDAPPPADFVLGVGPASRSLAGLAVRSRVASALDLGTGCGFLAILASRHADRVVATDINARALNFAGFNARLNGAANVELRQGSLYEPVADERFDLLLCNPPFVISPRSNFEYCDSGMAGDSISEQVIRGAPEHLNEGAFCSILFNWHHRDESDWAIRPDQWVAGNGCNTWIVRSDKTDPVSYATTWLHHERANASKEEYGRLIEQWLRYYERLGAGQISSGMLVMQRRTGGPNWRRIEEAPPGAATGSSSGQILRIFAGRDLLAGLSHERDLLGVRLELTGDHQMEQVLHADGGRWTVQRALLRQLSGFPFVGEVDRLTSTLLAGCELRTAALHTRRGLNRTRRSVGQAFQPDEIRAAVRWERRLSGWKA